MIGKETRQLFNLLHLFLFFPVVFSQILLGSRISSSKSESWISPNGDFSIGFFNSSGQFSVGIKFNSNSIPDSEKTVVWVAGADLKVSKNSYFELNMNGELVLFDALTESTVWTSNTGDANVSSAVLQNDGNLVLLSRNKSIVWQSFQTPSDILIPGQNLSVFQTLRPRTRNSVSSYYTLYLDASGQLQLRWETSVIYWTNRERRNPSESIKRATLSSNGVFQLLDQRSELIWAVYGEDHNDSNVKFRFLRLDYDGNLRLYSWDDGSKSWISVWQAVFNQCEVFATCDLQGICMYNSSGAQICECSFGLKMESISKCLVPYRDNCESGFSMIAYEHTFLYGIYPPNETLARMSLEQCKTECENDPTCTAATFTNDGSGECRMKSTRYIGGRFDASLSSVSFVKSCSDPTAVFPTQPHSLSPAKRSRSFCVPCLIGVLASTSFTFVLIQIGIGLWLYKRRKANSPCYSRRHNSNPSPNSSTLTVLSYSEIEKLTDNFKVQIGPNMFKGVISNNRLVLVKRLDPIGSIDEDRKFRRAVSKIGNIHHKNIARLVAYCCESGHRFLVHEFVALNGSLARYLDDPALRRRLTWRRRMEICLAVARAISYLHTGCREFVSHGNLRCENVILDENFEARVSEFGLLLNGVSSADGDVGDFGKMVVEVVSGCRDDDGGICGRAYEWWAEGEAAKVLEAKIGVDLVELDRVLKISFWCVQSDDRLRPSMGEVVKVLEGTLAVDSPPPPFDCRRSSEDFEEASESDQESKKK